MILDQIEDRFAEGGVFDPCLPLNDQIRFLMEEKKGHAAALEHLMSERQKVLDYGKGFVGQHEQLVCDVSNLTRAFNPLEVLVMRIFLVGRGRFSQTPELQALHPVDGRSGTGDAFFACSCCLNVEPRRLRL